MDDKLITEKKKNNNKIEYKILMMHAHRMIELAFHFSKWIIQNLIYSHIYRINCEIKYNPRLIYIIKFEMHIQISGKSEKPYPIPHH